jgi:polyphosphate kinase
MHGQKSWWTRPYFSPQEYMPTSKQARPRKPERTMSKKSKNHKKSKSTLDSDSKRAGVNSQSKILKKEYEAEIFKLQVELVKLQDWVKATNARIVIVFEGRDAAGKGGMIKRIMERVSPRIFRVVALPAPTEREKTQLHAQRYVEQLPAGGEVVIFDRSWYNRAAVEYVMGFCTKEEHRQFLRDCPTFEGFLISQGIILLKYWLEVSKKEQHKRFLARIRDHSKRWKLSPMDLESHRRWYDYSRARDAMLAATNTPASPWFIVPSDDKKRARLNCIAHILSSIPYEEIPYTPPKLPPRQKRKSYVEPKQTHRSVPLLW